MVMVGVSSHIDSVYSSLYPGYYREVVLIWTREAIDAGVSFRVRCVITAETVGEVGGNESRVRGTKNPSIWR